jgi:iron(III) transport system substrate-binding protein
VFPSGHAAVVDSGFDGCRSRSASLRCWPVTVRNPCPENRRTSARAPGWAIVGAVVSRLIAGSPTLLGDESVIVISPHNEEIRFEFGRAFEQWHEQLFGERVGVEWRDAGGSADALRFVLSEFSSKPEGIGIDVFFGGGPEPVLLLADRGLALAHTPPPEILEGVPQSFNGIDVFDPDHRWFGSALSSFGILENRRVLLRLNLPFIRRWEDLNRPELYGWVGIGDPRNSGTMNNMFEAMLQAFGWKRGWSLLTEISGNCRRFDRFSSTTAKDVTLGETAYAFAIDFYALTQIASAGRTNLALVLPEDFTAMSPDGMAILKGAPHLELAQRFIDFVLSDAGQKLWFLPRGHPGGPTRYSIERMPVRPDLYRRYRDVSNIEFSPFEVKQRFHYDSKLARDRREVVAALAGALLVDTHSELRSAWRAVIRRGLVESDREALGRMPVTEKEASDLAASARRDPVLRNRMKIEWQSWALSKYRQLSDPHPLNSKEQGDSQTKSLRAGPPCAPHPVSSSDRERVLLLQPLTGG